MGFISYSELSPAQWLASLDVLMISRGWEIIKIETPAWPHLTRWPQPGLAQPSQHKWHHSRISVLSVPFNLWIYASILVCFIVILIVMFFFWKAFADYKQSHLPDKRCTISRLVHCYVEAWIIVTIRLKWVL